MHVEHNFEHHTTTAQHVEGELGGLPVLRWLPLATSWPRHGWVTFDPSDRRVVSAALHAHAAHMRLRGTVAGNGCEIELMERLDGVGDAVYRWVEFPTSDSGASPPR
jgi:hypothetical protein